MTTRQTQPSSNFYGVGAGMVSSNQLPINPIVSNRAPTTSDFKNDLGFFPIGQVWIDTTGGYIYYLTGISIGSAPLASWSPTAGTSQLTELYANAGRAIGTGGIVTVSGSLDQTTSSASGAAVTLSFPSAIVAPNTLTSTLSITTNGGNFVRGVAGSKDFFNSVATTQNAGSNTCGIIQLIGGGAVINTIAVSGNSLVRLYRQTTGNSTALGDLYSFGFSPSQHFSIIARSETNPLLAEAGDNSIVFWQIIN